MPRLNNFYPPKPQCFDFDDDLEGPSYHVDTNVVLGHDWAYEVFPKSIDDIENDEHVSAQGHAKHIADLEAKAFRPDSPTYVATEVWPPQNEDISNNAEFPEPDRRVAEWVETQQVQVHVTLPLDSFESMVDQLIATEEALEKLKASAFSCLKGAQPLWKRSDDLHHEELTRASELVISPKGKPFGPRPADTEEYGCSRPGKHSDIPMVYEPSLPNARHGEKAPVFERRKEEEPGVLTRSDKGQTTGDGIGTRQSDAAQSHQQFPKMDTTEEKQTSDTTSKAVTLPTSWLDDSSSQSSCEEVPTSGDMPKPELRVFTSLPGFLEDREGDMEGRSKPIQEVATSSKSIQSSTQYTPSPDARLRREKSGAASRIESRLRNGVDKFLLKMRPSRTALPRDTPTSRSPLTLSPKELDAYLALPTDAVRPIEGPKMVPRPATGDRNRRVLTSRHSAPLLRGK